MSVQDYNSQLRNVAGLMELAARTAPKSHGEDYVQIMTISGSDVGKLAHEMIAFGKRSGKENFWRDAENVRQSPVVVLIGLKEATTVGLNCGACGYASCSELEKAERTNGEFSGPLCVLRQLDLGIALGSAVKMAQMLNADNRIMYRVGVAARSAGLVNWDIVMGVPLSATGKNIYFDREKK